MKKQQKMQRRVTILASSMTISFYITWMPYAIDCILSMSGIKIAHATNVYAILFAKTGTVVNPILYIFLNKDVSISEIELRGDIEANYYFPFDAITIFSYYFDFTDHQVLFTIYNINIDRLLTSNCAKTIT